MVKLRKLKRDKVISIVNGKDLVGVYFADTDGSQVLIECSPEKADKIIEAWNKKDSEFDKQTKTDELNYELATRQATGDYEKDIGEIIDDLKQGKYLKEKN